MPMPEEYLTGTVLVPRYQDFEPLVEEVSYLEDLSLEPQQRVLVERVLAGQEILSLWLVLAGASGGGAERANAVPAERQGCLRPV